MKIFENKLFDIIKENEPQKLKYVTEKSFVDPSNETTFIMYEDTKKMSKDVGIGSKSINTWLNNPKKQMSYAEAIIMSEALTKKYGQEIKPEMLMKEIKK